VSYTCMLSAITACLPVAVTWAHLYKCKGSCDKAHLDWTGAATTQEPMKCMKQHRLVQQYAGQMHSIASDKERDLQECVQVAMHKLDAQHMLNRQPEVQHPAAPGPSC